jgi:hypothetical protein
VSHAPQPHNHRDAPDASSRITGVQLALLGLVAAIEAWREQFTPREHVVLLDLLGRWLDRELARRTNPPRRRWAA